MHRCLRNDVTSCSQKSMQSIIKMGILGTILLVVKARVTSQVSSWFK